MSQKDYKNSPKQRVFGLLARVEARGIGPSLNNYNLEIVGALLRQPMHIRELARYLGTSQTTIARKIRWLKKENVIDTALIGKNKLASLKKTAEARIYAYLWEHYNLLRILKKYPELRRIIDAASKFDVLIILFGSYAKGLARRDSDIDLFIETKNTNIKEKIEALDSRLRIKLGKFGGGSPLIKEIEKNHAIINKVEPYYEKTGIFG